MHDTTTGPASPEADALLGVVTRLAQEVRPTASRSVRLDSSFDRDLGFDSLTLVELLDRVERGFDVELPEELLAGAETPGDLLEAIGRAPQRVTGGERASSAPIVTEPAGGPAVVGQPSEAESLLDVLAWHVDAHPDRLHLRILEEDDTETDLSYDDLHADAAMIAQGLRSLGVGPGESVALMLPTARDYFACFAGALACGAVPVPLYPPARPSQIEDHMRRHVHILDNARATVLVTVPQARTLARIVRPLIPSLRDIVVPEELHEATGHPEPFHTPRARDTAFLQYTSGSTGIPKGVVLSHANLLANIRAMKEAGAVTDDDVFVSWLPLYHDMGLIGAWLGSLYAAMPLVVMSPLRFLGRPSRWLWAIHNHRGTLSAAPNFAYELCLKRIDDADIEGLDLSSWRLAFNGAEPVRAETLDAFAERFAPYGLRREALSPVYGLAESSVGLAFPPLGRGPKIDVIDRGRFLRTGNAEPAPPDDDNPLKVVACGRPLPGHEIQVVDAAGHNLPERREGRVQFRGPSVTSGYMRNPEATSELFSDGWVESGDLGYLAGGDIHLTGREKDLIIRAGRNLHPEELESAIGELDGIRKGCVALFSADDAESATERLVVLAETRSTDEPEQDALRRAINDVSVDLLGTPPDDIVLAPPGSVLKTSSGKIRRAASRERYESGDVGPGAQRSPTLQIVRLAWTGAAPQARRWGRVVRSVLFAAWVWLVVTLFVIPVRLGVALLPRVTWRRRYSRGMCRIFMFLTATRMTVEGREHLPDEPGVYVANHQSVLDSVAMLLVLPIDTDFVAAADWQQPLVTKAFLARLGARFVERQERVRGIEDVKELADEARKGQRLLVFSEGRLARYPGVRRFQLGAFMVAAESGRGVVPIGIAGTRSILRTESRFPRHGHMTVRIGEPLVAGSGGWDAAVELRDEARQQIADLCGEPLL